MNPLPIDSILPAVVASLHQNPCLLISASPGAGKTTRIPRALFDARPSASEEIWVLEPRRIAARMAARRVAEEMGEKVGESVGYQVRFDEVSGPRTRIRFLTEGVLTRKLLGNPSLQGVKAVILDEFHERHLQSDLALALLRGIQKSTRPELQLVVMSATLEEGRLRQYLNDCPTLSSDGRSFEVRIEYDGDRSGEPVHERVCRALPKVLDKTTGDILVFLPGASDIRKTQSACASLAQRAGCVVLPLHGDMSPTEQDQVVRPRQERRIILATNVAETSITIEGVTGVIDSGLARKASHSPWSGLQTLAVERISQASAIQRAGRAGRLSEGYCVRLYSEMDFSLRPRYELPEIARLDLAGVLLDLAGFGYTSPKEFEWFEPPPSASLDSGLALLKRLKAVSADGSLTMKGKEMTRVAAHPRLSSSLIDSRLRQSAAAGALVAALLGERPLQAGAFAQNEGKKRLPNILDMKDLFLECRKLDFDPGRLAALGVSVGAARSVDAAFRQYLRASSNTRLDAGKPECDDTKTVKALLSGFPDRVARLLRAEDGIRRSFVYELANGTIASLEADQNQRPGELIVIAQAEEESRGPAGGAARTAVRIYGELKADWLFDSFPDEISSEDEFRWNSRLERLEGYSLLKFGSLVIESGRLERVEAGAAAGAALFNEAKRRGAAYFLDAKVQDSLIPRWRYLSKVSPGKWEVPGQEWMLDRLEDACKSATSFAELKELLSFDYVRHSWLTADQWTEMEKQAPEYISLPARKRVPVQYPEAGDPYVSSRIQDFFGMEKVPELGGKPLLVHLLAPSNRPLQVTRDLGGFWVRLYPEVRRELMRRYPKHKWPENPLKP